VSLLSGFEHRLERAVDGFFAKIFRSGVHPVEIGKRLLRVMEDGKTVALKRTYVPNSYTIWLSQKDYEKLAPIEPKLVEELEVFVSEAARQRDWVLADTPRVSFATGHKLSAGEFRVDGDAVTLRSSRDRERKRIKRPASSGEATRPRPRSPALVVLADGQPLKTVAIDDRVRIGRQSDNDIVLPDAGVSRHHAEVVNEEGSFTVRDLGSTNGTILNGETVEEAELFDGDRITVGHTVIEFRRA
jgi:hypothetical protein